MRVAIGGTTFGENRCWLFEGKMRFEGTCDSEQTADGMLDLLKAEPVKAGNSRKSGSLVDL